jgi:PEGA domain
MGLKLVAFVTLGVIALLAGQPVLLAQSGVAPLPPIGLPLPRIGLPLPRIGLPPLSPQGGGVPSPAPKHRAPRSRSAHRTPTYIVPAYGWPLFYEVATTTATADYPGVLTTPSGPPVTGLLTVDVETGGDQQIYIDGYYVGTAVELGGQLELKAGPHVIEIRTAGYETLRVPIHIAAGRSITYRGSLKATSPPPTPDVTIPSPAPSAPAAPMTAYIIPGCYVGNVPPTEVTLPASCDVSQVIRIN